MTELIDLWLEELETEKEEVGKNMRAEKDDASKLSWAAELDALTRIIDALNRAKARLDEEGESQA